MTKAARGSGWVYLRGRVFWAQYHDHGVTIRVSTGKTTKRAADAFLRRQTSARDEGLHHVGADRVRFSDLATLIRRDYQLNHRRSTARLEFALTNLGDYFGKMKATEMKPRAYANARLEEKAAPATVKRELAVLRRMFALAVEEGSLARVPAMPKIDVDNARTQYFEREHLDALLAELSSPLHAPAFFAYLTGWRMKSEILPLRWKQVDLDGGFVRLEPGRGTTKSGEGREFPTRALPELHALLTRQRENTPADCEWVFHRDGARIKSIRTAWTNAVDRANLDGRNPHDFRRTAVRNLERAGVSRSVAMQLVGHKTGAMYSRYAITPGQDLKEGVAKLAKHHDTLRAAPDAVNEAV